MISRRDKLLKYPWEQQRYEHHRKKVQSAKPAIDVRSPHIYAHVVTKLKKAQSEKERLHEIEKENVRLLQKLGDIMCTKRMKDIWLEPRPNFLNREKLFEVRAESNLPRCVAIYSSGRFEPIQLKAPDAKTAKRCPTCKGSPETTQVFIPEKRIPWQVSLRYVKKKPKADAETKYCYHCGHARTKTAFKIV